MSAITTKDRTEVCPVPSRFCVEEPIFERFAARFVAQGRRPCALATAPIRPPTWGRWRTLGACKRSRAS